MTALRVYLLGRFEVERDGEILPPQSWRRRWFRLVGQFPGLRKHMWAWPAGLSTQELVAGACSSVLLAAVAGGRVKGPSSMISSSASW